MRKKLESLAMGLVVLVGAATHVNAMTENWSAIDTRFLTIGNGTIGVPSGDLLKLGILRTSEANMIANRNNLFYLDANFDTWATGTVGSGTGVDGSFTMASIAPGAGYFSKQIYLLAFTASTVAQSGSGVGLFTNPSWIFPASDIAPANSLDLADQGLRPLIGRLFEGTITSPADIAGSDAADIGVPEPATLSLVGWGLLSVLGFVRCRWNQPKPRTSLDKE